MEQTDWIFWGVGYLFYLPMHVGLPLLYLLLQGDMEQFRTLRRPILIHSVVSTALVFAVAIQTWPHSKLFAIALLVAVMLLPWQMVWKARSQAG